MDASCAIINIHFYEAKAFTFEKKYTSSSNCAVFTSILINDHKGNRKITFLHLVFTETTNIRSLQDIKCRP